MRLPEFLKPYAIEPSVVPETLSDPKERGVLWQAQPGRFLLHIPKVARFLVEDGKKILIDAVQDADREAVNHFLCMTPLAALLYQRGILAFHASAVCNGDGTILLAGDSGVGKSTLLVELVQRGWTMLSDDLSVVGLDAGTGKPVVFPTFPEIPLWPKALEGLGISLTSQEVAFSSRRLVSLPDAMASSPQPLRAIYWLGIRKDEGVESYHLQGTASFRTLGSLLYNSHIADVLLDRSDYLKSASAVIKAASLIRLRRTQGKWSTCALAETISEQKNFIR